MTPNRLQAVERACGDLCREGRAVTFTAVAAATGISRTSLYRQSAIRAVINEHHHRDIHNSPIASITDEIATLRTIVEELAERVRRHEEQLRQLG